MKKLLLVCAVLAPGFAMAAETGNDAPLSFNEPNAHRAAEDRAAREVQLQELATLKQISAEVASLRADIRCIRIRAAGGAC